jgi:NADH-quinone oxidoreductase subunit G
LNSTPSSRCATRVRGRDVQASVEWIDPAARLRTPSGIQRIAEVPIYFADPLVRRAPSLQATRDARPPKAWMNGRLLHKLGVAAGQPVLARMDGAVIKLAAALDDKLPDDCVRIAAAHASTAQLGPMFGSLAVAKAPVEKAA